MHFLRTLLWEEFSCVKQNSACLAVTQSRATSCRHKLHMPLSHHWDHLGQPWAKVKCTRSLSFIILSSPSFFPHIWPPLLSFRHPLASLLLHPSLPIQKEKSISKINMWSFWLHKGIKEQSVRATAECPMEVDLFFSLEELLHIIHVCLCQEVGWRSKIMRSRMFLTSRKNYKLHILFLPLKHSSIHILINSTFINAIIYWIFCICCLFRDTVVLSLDVRQDRDIN